MLKLNKYLRELGIDENFYLFDEKMKQLDCRYKEDENVSFTLEFEDSKYLGIKSLK